MGGRSVSSQWNRVAWVAGISPQLNNRHAKGKLLCGISFIPAQYDHLTYGAGAVKLRSASLEAEGKSAFPNSEDGIRNSEEGRGQMTEGRGRRAKGALRPGEIVSEFHRASGVNIAVSFCHS